MLPSVEHIPHPARSSFACRLFDLPAFPFRWHHHPEIELTLVTSGRGQRFVGDHIARFGPGDLVLLGENLPHTWHSSPRRGQRSGSVVIQFRRDFMGGGFFTRPEMLRIGRLLDRAARGLHFSGPAASAVARRMSQMPGMRELDRLLSLVSCLDDLSRQRGSALASPRFRPALRADDERRIDRVWRMVSQDLTESTTQAEVATALRMTPEGFSRFFKRATGRTFVSYMHELRVGEACRLLIETDTPITDVCFAAGFGNLSNFNRIFRRLRGVSPRQYRRAYQDAAVDS